MTVDAGYLVLWRGAMRLTVDPRRGGAIREFTWRGQNVMRPTPAGAGDDPFEAACFPMVPFVNRIARGRFEFGGHAVHLQPNWSGDPNPIHGQGWRAEWRTVNCDESEARLRFEGGGNEWPWPYAAEQRFRLLETGLFLELSVENLGTSPMPAMLGLHPYFTHARQARLKARLPSVWLTDAQVLPVRETSTPEEWGFDTGRDIQAVPLDHSFAGWDGIATVIWDRLTCTLRAPRCGYLHVYAPSGRDFFCLEPQTAAPGALGRSTAEPTVVPPGERFAMGVFFEPGAA